MTVAEALRNATGRLGTDWARDEAEMLMAHALGVTRSAMLLGHMAKSAPDGFEAMVARRLADEPVAQIIGRVEFYGRTFVVTPDVLIPRGDSETTLLAALEAAPHARRVLDCGTGSGCLLLSILAELRQATGVGIDRSRAALAVAGTNAAQLGVADRAELREADWTAPGWADGLAQFDLIIANPPYIAGDAELDASVRDYEPHGALFAGTDGLADYHALIPQLSALLTPEGTAVLEIGWQQAEAVSAIARAAGFTATLRRDLADRPRALVLSADLG